MHKMKKFTSGQKVVLSLDNCNILANRAFHRMQAIVNFQCITIEGVQGLVYVDVMLKGKRKPRSVTCHVDNLTLV